MNEETRKTADELMAELESNPDFVRRSAEKQQRRQARAERVAAQERTIIERLRALGFELSEVSEAAGKYAPLPDEFVAVLLDAVRQYGDVKEYTYSNVLEMIIRALGAAGHPFDGRTLVECYEKNTDPTVRWVICNTISLARPTNIEDWIQKALANPQIAKTLREVGLKKGKTRRKSTGTA